MAEDITQAAARVNPLLEATKGMTLVDAQLVKEGIRSVYEGGNTRKVIVLQPKVYTDGSVIVDPINDVVMVLSVSTYDATAYKQDPANAQPTDQSNIELPYSLWLFEGNYR